MASTFTSKFFQLYREDVMDLLVQKLTDFQLPDTTPDYNLGVGKVYLALTKQRLVSFIVDKNRSQIMIQNEHPYIQFAIQNVSLNFALDFDLYSKPEWIKDKGVGKIDISNFNISLHLTPFNNNGKFQIDFSDVIIDVSNYTANFTGQSDFSKALTMLLNSFKSFFKDEVANMMARKVAKSFEESLNAIMNHGPSIVPIDEKGLINFNYTLVGSPIFNKDHMTVPFDGRMFSAKSQ